MTDSPKSSSDTLATISLVCGFLSFVPIVSMLTALIAIITGIVALAKKTAKKASAIWGIVLSVLGFIISPFIMIAILAAVGTNLDKEFKGVESQLKATQENPYQPPTINFDDSVDYDTDMDSAY